MSKVYFTSSRAPVKEPHKWYQPSLSGVNKLDRLLNMSGILEDIEKGEIIALKMHFGIRGTTKSLRSMFIRKVAQMVKAKGGEPFVTETTGLGMLREQCFALSKIEAAEASGYTHQTLSAPIIIADGLRGFDCVEVSVDGSQLKKVYVAKQIAEADKVISLAHFKGHMNAGFGGALKNIGIGCVAKTSKYDAHIYSPPNINDNCTECGACVKICPVDAIIDWKVDVEKCIRCQGCAEVCEEGAISFKWASSKDLSERFVDCAKAVLDLVGKENIKYVNFLLDITPHCDCCPYSDNAIVPDLGILASDDILAIDKASVDMVNKAPVIADSMAQNADDKFHGMYGWVHSSDQLDAAKKLGLGEMEYELIEIDPIRDKSTLNK
ncbi:MAG TPA: DUF362 domain-containing protein [Methanocellales archaeon]|nr:DUF362 domain-containing protein [Methanocellales archaeon]